MKEELLKKAKERYNEKDCVNIERAYDFAQNAHSSQKRASGEPYISHPANVAMILMELNMDAATIQAGLLHDVIEDTPYEYADIEKEFGGEVAALVDGVTKLNRITFDSKEEQQAESLRKMFIATAKDTRVILVKLADRLHNIRTLSSLPPEKQISIANETLEIYAPLANRLGIYQIKWELEDDSLRYLDPEAYFSIYNGIHQKKGEREEYIKQVIALMRPKLEESGIRAEIYGRAKHFYSIYRKMKAHNVGIDQIYDLTAVRIIVDSEKDCYGALGIVHTMFKPMPGRFKDYIAMPKANMYQSLHTTVIGPNGTPFEIQIRTQKMHETAEYGIAAHWKYKEGSKTTADSEDELEKWLHTIKEILDDPQPNALDFLDAIKLNLYASEIFVVTPKGEFKTMPADCTALDFAFSIHTFLGSHCIGAKVNHKLVPLSHKLQSGDQVEILTSKTQRVQKEWINFATTAKAKNKIQAILRREERELQKQGEEMLNEFFEKAEVEPNSMNIDKLCDLHRIKFREELFQAIGSKNVVLGTADLNVLHEKQGNKGNSWTHFIPFLKKKSPSSKTKEKPTPEQPISIDRKKTVVLNEENIQNFIIAECCHPIPGDDVLGYIDSDKHIYIHKRQCPVAAKLKTSDGNHILAATWDVHKTLFFPATIKVSGIDNIGILHEMTGVLSNQLNINIYKLTVSTKDGIFDCEIQLGVHDVEDVKTICNKLKNMTGIEEVTRID